MNYKVKIKYFSDKIYTNTDIETILQEISIFTDLENIISITKLTNYILIILDNINGNKIK